MRDAFGGLLRSRKFWLAVLGLAQTVLFQFVPSFPKEVWLSINALLIVVIAGITIEDAASKLSYRVVQYDYPIGDSGYGLEDDDWETAPDNGEPLPETATTTEPCSWSTAKSTTS